ncbi:MAG: ECF transporter S component [Bacilli bacterium]|nr:ECF transporter S component [Bacilli bacterium]MDD7374986.1 ECF transporter S component [Bacilli bacterium]MDD7549781.1 ECF transporter S component [Bacilli bacterium]MDY4155540.1 ECF transporter S component [Bacilli bacterium]MDY4723662.1 ECF transporter S component [Bacilli bacterium]
MNKRTINIISKMTICAMLLALGWVLPFLTGQIPQFGNMFLPMHLPVLIGGFVLGPWYGLFLGIVTPLTRSLLFTMPPIYPTATSMAFELAAYGFASGLLFKLAYKMFNGNDKKLIISIYVVLIIALIFGRLVYGLTMFVLTFITPDKVNLNGMIYISATILNAWPGIILQIVLIPAIIIALYKAKLLNRYF